MKGDKYEEYFRTRKPMAAGDEIVKLYHRVLFGLAARKIPDFKKLNILEVGVGFGYFADICREKGLAYGGIEQNRSQTELMTAAGYDVVCATVPPFPAGRSADLIWLSHVLEHADGYNQARNMLVAAKARLVPGGRLVIISPDIRSYKEEFWNTDWSHGYPTGLNRVKQLLSEAGYNIEYATYLTMGFTNPVLVFCCDLFFRWFPVSLLDSLAKKMTGRTLCSSFMTIFGWRQIFLVGRKR